MKTMKWKHFLWYQGPALALMLLIFVLSSFSRLPHLPLRFELKDKVIHAIVYGLLGYLLNRAFFHQHRFSLGKKYSTWFAIGVAIVYGISDEIHQYFVPGRSMDIYDLLADTVGAILGALIFYFRANPGRLWPGKNHPWKSSVRS